MGVQVIEIFTREMEIPEFIANTPRRCYHCKKELFEFCRKEAEDRGLKYVVDGSNVDDTGDFRPGMEAAKQLMVHSPLKEAGLTKAEIRDISREFGLSTWDKPSLACLSSRFPYGTKLTPERIAKVEKAEEVLHRLGFRQIRVRYHGDLARLEVEPQEIGRFIDPELRGKVVVDLKGIGFIYVTLDLQGYRTGAMNESLKSGSTEGFQ
jgi:pyridinium-3,5-biscarboxylic acid mononucleotide sulfurtransferase